jgi:tRNA (guanine37-N1)-methyltransferase
MSVSAPCLKVKKIQGQEALILASKLKIINRELRIQKNKDYIYLPLIRQLRKDELSKIKALLPHVVISKSVFIKEKQKTKSLVQALEDQLDKHLLEKLPRALDMIGDIAIVEIPPELETYESQIGEAVLVTQKNVRTVLEKDSAISGTYRIREYKIIAGEPRTTTIHKEYGCQYKVDVAKAYFSPRLSNEHNRIASLVQKRETIVDLFAGVGPFSILIAKKNPDVKVYAIDINPAAMEFLRKNIRLNRVENRVFPLLGDAKQTVDKQLFGVADRIIMNLPEKAMEFIDTACRTMKPAGGVVHYYEFIRLPDSLENLKLRFSNAVEKAGRRVDSFASEKTIRATAPYEWQAVLDAKIL